jgi:predicted Zn finger-like uncharacterized protein
MDITCPNCSAAYRVPDALVVRRKPLRCAACGERWVPELPDGGEARPPAPAAAGLPRSGLAELAPTEGAGVLGATSAIVALDSTAVPDDPPMSDAMRGMDLPPTPENMTGTGALTPKPAAPPPLVKSRGMLSRAPRRLRGDALLPMAWAASLAAVAGLFLLLWAFSGTLAAVWPPFGRVAWLLGG